MSTIVTPNMQLPVPVVGSESGPQYATDINNCMTILDGHTHGPGSGATITPSGINISSDLSFLSNNATLLRTSRYTPQSAALALASDVGCVYVAGVDLYFNDVSGNQIRITQAGSVAGSAGTITGLPSGTASASYAAGTFVFQSATNTSAIIDGQSFILRNNTASSKGLTLSPPNSMGSDYGLTLPSIPVSQSFMTLDNSGNMATPVVYPLATSGIANSAVTGNKIASGTISSSNIAQNTITGGNTGNLGLNVVTGNNIALLTISSANIAASTITGTKLVNNINLPGSVPTANGRNLVSSNTNNALGPMGIVRGLVGTGGAVILGEGWTATNPVANQYVVTFTTPFSSPPVVSASVATTSISVSVTATSTSSITLIHSGAVGNNYNINFIAIGIS